MEHTHLETRFSAGSKYSTFPTTITSNQRGLRTNEREMRDQSHFYSFRKKKMNDQQLYARSELQRLAMMNHQGFFDPRFMAASGGMRRPQRPVDEASDFASVLLQLKHRNESPQAAPSAANKEHLLALRAAEVQAARLRSMPQFRRGAGVPPVGAVYGYPTSSYEPFIERTPRLMEEPIISDMSWERLLGDTNLVQMKDRDLVPDSLFVAMAQMKPCKLTHTDRVGCYKTRQVGFIGMCCKHCGGQPGFGRYYPNSVRSLAQTTTSQTILKHIGGKCRFCPPHIRQTLLELQRQQAAKEGMAAGRPRYGSRKIFFQRMWVRLHGKRECDDGEEEDDEVSEEASVAEKDNKNSGSEDESIGAGQKRPLTAQSESKIKKARVMPN